MTNAIILLSGGLDSSVTSYYVNQELNPGKVLCLFIDYGQRARNEEEYCAREIAKAIKADFKKIHLDWLNDISTAFLNSSNDVPEVTDEDLESAEKSKKDILNWWVPCRNSLFLLAALAHAESFDLSKNEKYDVYIGLKNEGQVSMKDTTPAFVKAINNLVEHATHKGNYKIIAPLIDKDKDEIVSLALELDVPLDMTYSCYVGGGFENGVPVHCGKCENCKQRQKAFYWSGIRDVSVYNK